MEEAAQQSAQAEAARPRVTGQCADKAFNEFRDADDLIAGNLEVLTTTGKYYWIPIERIISAEFHPPARQRDLLWRRVSMIVADGPEGDVYMPAIYPATGPVSDAERLGRETNWRDAGCGMVCGAGQKTFLVGDEGIEVMALTRLRFGA
jgi:type VI secretion system protein ImpE